MNLKLFYVCLLLYSSISAEIFPSSSLQPPEIYPEFYFRKGAKSPIPTVYGQENGAILLSPKPKPEIEALTEKHTIYLPKPLNMLKKNHFFQKYFKHWSHNIIHGIIFVQLMIIHILLNFFSPRGIFYNEEDQLRYKHLLILLVILLECLKFKIKNNFLIKLDSCFKIGLLIFFFISYKKSTKPTLKQIIHKNSSMIIIFLYHCVNNFIFFLTNQSANFFDDFMMKNLIGAGLLIPLFNDLIPHGSSQLQEKKIKDFQTHMYKDNYVFIYILLTYIWFFGLLYKNVKDNITLQGMKKLLFISLNSLINNLLYFMVENYSKSYYNHHFKTAIFFGFLIIVLQNAVNFPLKKYEMIFWSCYGIFLMKYIFSSFINQFKVMDQEYPWTYRIVNFVEYFKKWLVTPFITDAPVNEEKNISEYNDNEWLKILYEKAKANYKAPSGIHIIIDGYNYVNKLPPFSRRWVILNGFVYFVLT